jgi:hypothetical protein
MASFSYNCATVWGSVWITTSRLELADSAVAEDANRKEVGMQRVELEIGIGHSVPAMKLAEQLPAPIFNPLKFGQLAINARRLDSIVRRGTNTGMLHGASFHKSLCISRPIRAKTSRFVLRSSPHG